MVTDDERREVAERLRELDDSELQVYDMTYFAIRSAVGCEGDQCPDGRKLVDRLADLIDPTCLARADVEDTPDGGQFDCWSCSVCGNILSSDPDYDTDTDGHTYCEVCGHRIIGKGEPTWL